jgi:DNA helicase-2/ATP-dependent DNA helicase PcrA
LTGLRPILEHAPGEVVRQVIERSGYGDMLKNSSDSEDEQRYENVLELITAANQFASADESRTIGDFLESVALASDTDGWDEEQDKVSVMTLHAAKGLEFPVVYILAVEQGVLPHARSLELDQVDEIEEERRLCFVGMTRAKQELCLSYAKYREFGGQQRYTIASDFLHELPPEVETEDMSHGFGGHAAANHWRLGGPESAKQGWADAGYRPHKQSAPDDRGFFVGAIVEHHDYGNGKILELSGLGRFRRVKVRFRNGEQIFVGEHVKLSVIDPENAG